MSQLDRFLVFAFNHQTIIIEILFALILSIVVLWLFSHLKQEDSQIDTLQNVDEIEAALRRVLNSSSRPTTAADISQLISDDDLDLTDSKAVTTPVVNTSVATSSAAPAKTGLKITAIENMGSAPASGPTGVPTANADVAKIQLEAQPIAADKPASGVVPVLDPAELGRLKAENEVKAKKLEEVELALNVAKLELHRVQEQASKALPTENGDHAEELQAKIKILESRLSEYEIIEDDIANLSLYKEENLRLKSEMNSFKTGEEKPKTSAAAESSGLSDVALAMKMTTAMTTASAVATSPADAPIDADKLLKEFDGMVKANAAAPSAVMPSAAISVAASTLAAAPAASAAASATEKDSSQKLIEEFENFMKGSGS